MQVLVHRITSTSFTPWFARVVGFVLYCPSIILWIAVIRFPICLPANGQILSNGQVFTNGLAIVDAPNPKTTLHAGSAMNLAIDVSGDGKLPQIASTTGFDSLAIFLVSSQNGINETVTTDPGFLTQEPGSTVKHLNWPIPTCLPPGQYNLTVYEAFHLQGVNYFGITPIALQLENNQQQGNCTSLNALEAQPQLSSSPPQNPWLGAGFSSAVPSAVPATVEPSISNTPTAAITSYGSIDTSSAATGIDTITITVGPLGVQLPLTIVPPFFSETIVLQPVPSFMSGMITVYATPAPTSTEDPTDEDGGTVTVMVTPTATPTPVTVVFVSMNTVTGTMAGEAGEEYTSTSTSFATTTAMVGPPGSSPNSGGFLPINAVSSAVSSRSSVSYIVLLFITALAFV